MSGARDFLKSICDETGVSGYETRVAELVKTAFSEYCDAVTTDNFGNVVGLRRGAGKGKVMFAAHMDEIGLMVKYIEDDGFIRFTTVGGYDQRTLLSQEVIIHTETGPLFGVIGMKPPHIIADSERDKAIKLEDLAIDAGYSKEEIEKLVRIGDIVTINRKTVDLQNDVLAGKALDDRAGVASMLVCMESLKDFRHDMDVYYVATTQEEVGCKGAKVSSYSIRPDIGIAIDVGFGRTPELKEHESVELCKGPAIAIGPNMHPAVVDGLRDAAKENNIPFQIEVIHTGHSGTDARELQMSGDGAASGLLSIPLKYMHTPVELMSMKDITNTGKLLAAYVESLNGCDLEVKLCL